MWCVIKADSFYNLILNYDKIDFSNFEISKSNFNGTSNKLDIFKIIVDNLIEAHYIHHHFHKDYSKVYVKDIDVFYNKIWEYIVEKYEERIKRINDKPTFLILGETTNSGFNLETEEKILKIKTPYKIILITKYKQLLNYNDDTHLIIFDDTYRNGGKGNHLPDYYCDKHYNQINDFISN